MFSQSRAFRLDGIDWVKLGRTALIAAAAAVLPVFGEAIANADFGIYDHAITGVLVLVLDAARRWARDNTKNLPKN